MVKQYRTKPCEIKAIQLTKENAEEISKFTEGKAYNFRVSKYGNKILYCDVETLEGIMTATENDYIIKGLRGEYYPCKPDVFEKKYEEIM